MIEINLAKCYFLDDPHPLGSDQHVGKIMTRGAESQELDFCRVRFRSRIEGVLKMNTDDGPSDFRLSASSGYAIMVGDGPWRWEVCVTVSRRSRFRRILKWAGVVLCFVIVLSWYLSVKESYVEVYLSTTYPASD